MSAPSIETTETTSYVGICEYCGESSIVQGYCVGYHHESENQAEGVTLCEDCSSSKIEEDDQENAFTILI